MSDTMTTRTDTTLTRMVVKDAHISGHVAGELTITGYVVRYESSGAIVVPAGVKEPTGLNPTPPPVGAGAKEVREILRPVEPDEPDTEVEVGLFPECT